MRLHATRQILCLRNKMWVFFAKRSLETIRYVSLMKEKDKSMQLTIFNGSIVYSHHQIWTLECTGNKRQVLNNKFLEIRKRLRRFSWVGAGVGCVIFYSLSSLTLKDLKLENHDAHQISQLTAFWEYLFYFIFFSSCQS